MLDMAGAAEGCPATVLAMLSAWLRPKQLEIQIPRDGDWQAVQEFLVSYFRHVGC